MMRSKSRDDFDRKIKEKESELQSMKTK